MGDIFKGLGDIYDEVEVTAVGNKPKEPTPGAYVLKILGAKIERFSGGKVAFKLKIDIAEGEFADYYKRLYEYNKSGKFSDDAKWKGTFSIFIPDVDEGDPDYKKQVASFKRSITAINDSNKGKPLDGNKGFNTDDFKGKKVGGAFGLVDWEYNGKEGTRCECRWLVGVDRVKAGEVDTPAHKGVNGAKPKATADTSDTPKPVDIGDLGDFEEILSDDDVPF